MQPRKNLENYTKLKEEWGIKDHLLSWHSNIVINMRLTRERH